jgi:antitoxin component YwqK of YwqJK toxin-antitoxin module
MSTNTIKPLSSFIFLLAFAILLGCQPKEYVDITLPGFSQKEELLYQGDEPYSGLAKEAYIMTGELIKGKYEKGLKQGEWVSNHENGKIMTLLNYQDGKETGPSMSNYENGNPMLQGALLNGLEDGEWKLFYENGQLLSRSTFQKGVRVGVREEFYEDGGFRERSRRRENSQ